MSKAIHQTSMEMRLHGQHLGICSMGMKRGMDLTLESLISAALICVDAHGPEETLQAHRSSVVRLPGLDGCGLDSRGLGFSRCLMDSIGVAVRMGLVALGRSSGWFIKVIFIHFPGVPGFNTIVTVARPAGKNGKILLRHGA